MLKHFTEHSIRRTIADLFGFKGAPHLNYHSYREGYLITSVNCQVSIYLLRKIYSHPEQPF